MPYSAFERALRDARKRRGVRRAEIVLAAAAVAVLVHLLATTGITLHEARVVASVPVAGGTVHDRMVAFEIDGRTWRRRLGDWMIPSVPAATVCMQRVRFWPVAVHRLTILHPGYCRRSDRGAAPGFDPGD